jgi:hypothetical protein
MFVCSKIKKTNKLYRITYKNDKLITGQHGLGVEQTQVADNITVETGRSSTCKYSTHFTFSQK